MEANLHWKVRILQDIIKKLNISPKTSCLDIMCGSNTSHHPFIANMAKTYLVLTLVVIFTYECLTVITDVHVD